MDQTLLAYLAGYFDGEGTVALTTHKARGYICLAIAVGSGDEEVIRLFLQTFGGQLYKVKPSKRKKMNYNRQQWRWLRSGSIAQSILRELLPFLRAKKAVAELALLPNFNSKAARKGRRLVQSEHILRTKVRQEVMAINRRVTVVPVEKSA